MVMLVKHGDMMTKTDTEDKTVQMRVSIPSPSGLNSWSYTMKTVYSKPPHIFADNFFSSEKLMNYLGAKGYGMIATCACNNIPATIKQYMHSVKVDSILQWCKVMQLENSIVTVQHC